MTRITRYASRITYYVLLLVLLLAAMPIPPLPPEPIPTPAPRLGVAAALGRGATMCDGRTWQYWWSAAYPHSPPDCLQHVPFLVRGGDKPGQFAFEWDRIEHTLARSNHLYWMVWNEPESGYQGNLKPAAAVEFLHEGLLQFLPLAPNAKLIIGGVNGGVCGIRWLEEFVTLYRQQYGEIPNLAGWHFHPYADLWAGPLCDQPWQWNWAATSSLDNLWREWLQQTVNIKAFVLQYGRPGDEVWFTEFGCLAPAPAVCHSESYNLASRILGWLNGDGRWVTRAAWFADGGTHWWTWTHLYSGTIDQNNLVLKPIGGLWLGAELLPVEAMTFHKWYSPLALYGADAAIPAATPTPPGGYP